MSYMALYRKFRPKDFNEVRGQDAIVRTLRNQIIYERIGHAYLFCGTRGTGKTSIAKLFAKAVNCEHPIDGNPCNCCATCQAINSSSSMDVIEIDAASNNGVDNVREIREQVQYSPVSGRYKVYIIDEVHMLSPSAFNALLKTLEEPPSYVIFILATTEKHKVPITILSRCQKYDFKRISIETISDHLMDLMNKEGIDAEQEALSYIARVADGSMRDALSLLDQCISFYLGQTLTYDNVLAVLGTVDLSIFQKLLQKILTQETGSVLKIIEDMMNDGREMTQFLSDFLWYLRNLLILKDPHAGEENLDMSASSIAQLRKDSQQIETETLLRFIRILSELSNQLRNASQKRILLEVAFIKLCQPQMETDTGSLLERIRLLEEKMSTSMMMSAEQAAALSALTASGASRNSFASMAGTPGNPSQAVTAASKPSLLSGTQAEEALHQRFSPAELSDLREIKEKWFEIVNQFGAPMKSYLSHAHLVVLEDSKVLQLVFSETDAQGSMAKQYLEQNNHANLDLLSKQVAEQTGKEVNFQCAMEDKIIHASQNSPIDLSPIHGIKVELEEE